MIAASLYIVVCSARNRARMRLRRLRQPRYLVGAIAGAAYMYFTVFARSRPRSRRHLSGADPRRDRAAAFLANAAPPVLGTVLLGVAAAAWLFPFDSGLIQFSESEVDFLFTAPCTRRQLVVHRVLRSQLGLLFASIVFALFSPASSPAGRLRISLGVWLLLLTMRVYFTGVTLSRRALAAAHPTVRRAAWAVAAVIGGAAVAVGAALARAFIAQPANNLRDVIQVVHGVASSGWPRMVLAPAVAAARPLLATTGWAFAVDLGPALIVLAAVSAWTIWIDGLLHAVEDDASAGPAADSSARATLPARRPAPWTLAPAGRPELALAWRAAVDTIRSAGGVSMLRPIAVLIAAGVALAMATPPRGIAQLLSAIAGIAAFSAIVLGPQMLRLDLRQDLRNIDLLKTWPVRSPDLIRGEIAWPAAVLTVVSWVALAVAVVTSGDAFAEVPIAWRVAIAGAAAIVAPAVISAQLTIHNAAALAFPAWVASGPQRPRGLDAMGQRLILLGATMLLLAVMVLPGAAVGGAMWFALHRVLGAAVLVPAALACAMVLGVEVLVATEALGPLYDRLDLGEIERAET